MPVELSIALGLLLPLFIFIMMTVGLYRESKKTQRYFGFGLSLFTTLVLTTSVIAFGTVGIRKVLPVQMIKESPTMTCYIDYSMLLSITVEVTIHANDHYDYVDYKFELYDSQSRKIDEQEDTIKSLNKGIDYTRKYNISISSSVTSASIQYGIVDYQ